MKTALIGSSSRLVRRLLIFVWAAMLATTAVKADPAKTLVEDTLYRANGAVAQGTVTVRWSGFTTSAGEAVAAGQLTVSTDANGRISLPLVANTGSVPGGTFYRVVIKLKDGTTSEEQWVVPQAETTTIGAIRAKVVPQTVAAQFVGRDYVDSAISKVTATNAVHLTGDETVAGVKTFAVSPEVPVPADAGAAANKGYVDQGMAALAKVATTGDYQDLANKPMTMVGSVNQALSPMAFGAMCDGRNGWDGVAAESRTFTSATANFTQADVGKVINIARANTQTGAYLVPGDTKITAVNSATQVTMSNAATASATGVVWWVGTDDALALQNTINAAVAQHKNIALPAGDCGTSALLTEDLTSYSNGGNSGMPVPSIIGSGAGSSMITLIGTQAVGGLKLVTNPNGQHGTWRDFSIKNQRTAVQPFGIYHLWTSAWSETDVSIYGLMVGAAGMTDGELLEATDWLHKSGGQTLQTSNGLHFVGSSASYCQNADTTVDGGWMALNNSYTVQGANVQIDRNDATCGGYGALASGHFIGVTLNGEGAVENAGTAFVGYTGNAEVEIADSHVYGLVSWNPGLTSYISNKLGFLSVHDSYVARIALGDYTMGDRIHDNVIVGGGSYAPVTIGTNALDENIHDNVTVYGSYAVNGNANGFTFANNHTNGGGTIKTYGVTTLGDGSIYSKTTKIVDANANLNGASVGVTGSVSGTNVLAAGYVSSGSYVVAKGNIEGTGASFYGLGGHQGGDDYTNYQRVNIAANGIISTQHGGTGTAFALQLQSDAGTPINFNPGGTAYWYMDSSGNLYCVTNGGCNIGGSSHSPANLTISNFFNVNNALTIGNSGNLTTSGLTKFQSGALVQGFSDGGTTKTYQLNATSGLGQFFGGVQPGSTSGTMTFFGTGTTGSIGGSALTAGQCASGTVGVSNSTTSMVVMATPVTYPGDSFVWRGYVSAAGTVTVKVCAMVAGTPVASAYNVRVIQ